MSLKRALEALEAVVPTRPTSPLLGYVGVRQDEGRAVFFGSSGEVDLEVRTPLPLEGEGAFLAPKAPLIQVLKEVENPVLTVEGGLFVVEEGSFHAELRLAPADSFPEMTLPDEETWRPLLERGALPLVEKVLYAHGREEYKEAFRGVQLERTPGGLRAAASDGYRLAVAWKGPKSPVEEKVLVPASAAALFLRLARAASLEDPALLLDPRPKAVGLVGEGEGGLFLRASARLMGEKFPDYERVFPQETVLSVAFDREAFLEALSRLEVLADKANRRVDLAFEEDRARLTAEGDYGAGEEEVPLLESEGAPLALSFNARYLREAVERADPLVRARFSGKTTPAVIEGEGYEAVIVPLRV